MPDIAASGASIRLSCVYRLDGDQLYSIKWYKDGMEFFRYVPRDKPPAQFFPLDGLKIDLDRSFNGTVFIKDIALSTSGLYRCEVSADSPSFQTVFLTKELAVQEFVSSLGLKIQDCLFSMAIAIIVTILRV